VTGGFRSFLASPTATDTADTVLNKPASTHHSTSLITNPSTHLTITKGQA
jgi:hypothetical protein